MNDPPTGGGQLIQSLAVPVQLARLPMPRAFLLDGDPLGAECQVDASNETALAIRYLELRYRPQTGKREHHTQTRLLRETPPGRRRTRPQSWRGVRLAPR